MQTDPAPNPMPAAPTLAPAQPELGLTMTRILRHPLSALRASMERLASEFRDEDPRGEKLRGALEQVTRMTRDVQALVEWTAPRQPAPLSCSADEIVHGALRTCTYPQIARLSIARDSAPFELYVDGPLLADALAHVLQAAFAGGGETILLQARREADEAIFSIVQEGALAFDASTPAPGESASDTAVRLGLALARRDVERMGGTLTIERTPRGCTCAALRMPIRCAPGEPASALPGGSRRQSLR